MIGFKVPGMFSVWSRDQKQLKIENETKMFSVILPLDLRGVM